MSDLAHSSFDLPGTNEPVRVAVRRLRWFRAAFRQVVDRIAAETGTRFEVDEATLARVFVAWLRKVDRLNPRDPERRRAFFDHAAGMMLHELIEVSPLTVTAPAPDADTDRPEHFWPEGFCYTVFCMNVRAAALRQEYGTDAPLGAEIDDLRTWWSFRENVRDNRAYSVAFFKLFAGGRPNWILPDAFATEDERVLSVDAPATPLR